MLLTQKNNLYLNEEEERAIKMLCFHTARLYNVGLYSVRQHFFNTNSYLSYPLNYHECKNNENYGLLLSDTAQQILRIVDHDFRSFFGLLRLKNQGKHTSPVNIPHYKKKDGYFMLNVQGRSARIKKGHILVGLTKEFREKYNISFKDLKFKLPENMSHVKKLNELRISPKYGAKKFEIQYIYEEQEKEHKLNKKRYLSIDPGLDNFATCFDTNTGLSFIIDGKKIKSINQYFNKQKAELQSVYDKQGLNINTPRFIRLSESRKNKINHQFNKIVKKIVDYCIANKIGNVVIGYNKEQKQEINMGKTSNQNFVFVPFNKFRLKLKSKCELHGIKAILQEESYTSKASAYNLDDIPEYKKGEQVEYEFSGYRESRGCYKIKKEKIRINADVNGSVNIYRKYIKSNCGTDLSGKQVRAIVNWPRRFRA